MKRSMRYVSLLGILASTSALAGIVAAPYPATVTTTGTSKSETQAYVGLNWFLGGGTTPALVLGAVSTDVKSNGDTRGVNLAFHVNLAGGIAPGKLRLSALRGKENLQGELGAGYNFVSAKPFIGLGLNAPYIAVGVEGYLDPGLVPYATVHSLGAFDRPAETTTLSCNPGDTLSGTNCTPAAVPAAE